jgi:hypothetical protein
MTSLAEVSSGLATVRAFDAPDQRAQFVLAQALKTKRVPV